MSSRSSLRRGTFQSLRAEFQEAASRGAGPRHLLVRPLGTSAGLPGPWRRAVDDAEAKVTTEWSPRCTGYLDWDRPEAAYLYGNSGEIAAFSRLARQAWLAYPGSPDGKAQMAPRQSDADRWLTVVHRQLREHPGTYFEADGGEWAAFESGDGVRLVPAEQFPQGTPVGVTGRWRITALATDVFTASAVAIDALLASQDAPYAISWQEADAWQKSPAFQNANFLVDMIRLGEGRAFPIYRYWCKAVEGQTPSICPNADPPADARDRAVLRHYLPAIERRFRDLRLVGDGQTIHWVGRQASLGSLCRCEFGDAADNERQHEGASMAENSNPTGEPAYTLGQLICDLEGSERAYQENQRAADRIEERDGSISAYGFRIQAEALRWQPIPSEHPGIDRIEALCDAEWGRGLTPESVRRLRGRVCVRLGVDLATANAMTLDAVADALAPAAPVAGAAAAAAGIPAEDLPPYKAEEQPWFTPLPVPKELRSEELTALADEIDLVVITATDPELNAVLRLLEPYPRRKAILKGFVEQETYFLGKFGDCRAAVTQCRMGSLDPGSATLATGHAQRVWHPRAVVMVGIAFGKDPAKQKIADVLVASQVISYEPQRVGVQQTAQRGPITPSDATLLNRFVTVPHWSFDRPDGSRCERYDGAVLSGEKLVDEEEFKADLFARYPQAVGGEMEGVGLAAAAVRHRVPWILVKAICDWADGKKHGKHQPLAAAAAVSLAHHVLSQADVLHGLVKSNQP